MVAAVVVDIAAVVVDAVVGATLVEVPLPLDPIPLFDPLPPFDPVP